MLRPAYGDTIAVYCVCLQHYVLYGARWIAVYLIAHFASTRLPPDNFKHLQTKSCRNPFTNPGVSHYVHLPAPLTTSRNSPSCGKKWTGLQNRGCRLWKR